MLVARFAWGEIYANYILRRNEQMPFLFQELLMVVVNYAQKSQVRSTAWSLRFPMQIS